VLLAVWVLRTCRSRPARLAAAPAAAVVIASVGISRVYLGVHYPTDVAGGILLGAGWAAIVAATFAPSQS
jgi:undecaprenyl-diphosphatase